MPLSRVHLHPYGAFLMCYDPAKWEDAADAIVKGSISVPKYCINGSKGDAGANWTDDISHYEIPKLPK